uniref:Uncharacterized protein n=1 Tax=Photinus pyralis TaxID=7054 RepID=A0A1Y1N6V8_PHOPY
MRNLSQYAVQSKQDSIQKRPTESQLHPEKFSRFIGKGMRIPAIQSNAIIAKQNPTFATYPHMRPFPYYGGYPPRPQFLPGYQQPQQSFTSALHSIAKNDELQCVPFLLCELVSGPSNDLKVSLPFNIDLDSVVRFLPYIGGMDTSPILSFGKAVLLGYTSKGNTDSCMYAYPHCPRDPDRLIEYLNNYNGGFFRFFNGRPQPAGNDYNPLLLNQNTRPQRYPQFKNDLFNNNRRIQNQPSKYFTRPINDAFKFPSVFDDEVPQDPGVIFIRNYLDDNFEGNLFRKQKEIQFTDNYENGNVRPTPMVFPDRTGTGELILDDNGVVVGASDFVYFNK